VKIEALKNQKNEIYTNNENEKDKLNEKLTQYHYILEMTLKELNKKKKTKLIRNEGFQR